MKSIYKIIITIFSILIYLSGFNVVYADSLYKIADASSGEYEVVDEADNYTIANKLFQKYKDDYDNLVILEDEKVIKMEYGIVEFITKSCSLNTEYSSSIHGNAYINSCYAKDGAYLYTSNNLRKVTFKLAGDIGEVDIDLVNLVPYETLNVRLSKYSISDNELHHDIKITLENDYYTYSYNLDNKPEYLENDSSYFSYDGNYFYNDFKQMIDDYRNSIYDNSINSDDPYYNYYEYLPHRSYTNYNLNEVEDYFSNKLFIDGKIQFYDDLNLDNANDDVNLSQFFGELASFFGYEKIYGANAMMMISLATHESSYGKSHLAFTKNNLFGHAAFDSDVERSASRYNNIDTSIYSHAKYYISRSYAGVHSSLYNGSFFGNKLSGMNVNYASDPYWGEKAASNYYRFDQALGFKDKDSYSLGITNESHFLVYKDEALTNESFDINNIDNYSFIILDELENAYKIQVDASFSDEYLYDPESSIGYINKEIVDHIINEDKIEEKTYKTVSFDLDGGEIIDKDYIEIKALENVIPSISKPNKEGYEFVGYNSELSKDINTYKAQYKKIKSIEVSKPFNTTVEFNYMYNLKGGKLLVKYEDGKSKELNIDSNMIESYDKELEGQKNITINYCGVRVDYPIYFSKELTEYRAKLSEYIASNKQSYIENGTYNQEELNYIKDNLRKVDYLTSFDDIRYIDAMLLENTRDNVNYHFKDSKYDVSISGLALSLKNPKDTFIFKPFKDTYYVEVTDISNSSKKRLGDIALAYGFDIEDSMKVSVKYNLAKARFDNPIVIQVRLQDKKKDKIYSVYHLDDDGNVIKCMTAQSINYVSFMTRSEGDFMILSMDSVNTYDIEDRYENMSIHNADPDNHLLFIEGGFLIVSSILGFIMVIVNNVIRDIKERKWNDYKKLLLEAESRQEEKRKS